MAKPSRTNVRGVQDRRGTLFRPFTLTEEQEIARMVSRHDLALLYSALPYLQWDPRAQRVVQEAIERKRAAT